MSCIVETDYISVASNRTPGCMDWGQNGLICYGACNSVIICDPKHDDVCYNIQTLHKHTDRVNCVRWVQGINNSGFDEFVSGSSDKTAVFWQLNKGELIKTYILKGHEGVVTVVDSVYSQSLSKTFVATASVDSTVKIWTRNGDSDFVLLQTLTLGKVRCLALRLFILPLNGNIMLALGLDNDKIYLYAQQHIKDVTLFVKVEELIGHEDWVRALDFTTEETGDILLASSSQDTYVRLWRIFKSREMNIAETKGALNEQVEQEIRNFKIQAPTSDQTVSYSVVLESVLSGHENWVYSVHWQYPNKDKPQTRKLLSSSMDKTMIIWSFDEESGIWLESVRVGEVGGNSLGFYGGKFSPDGNSIMGHGYLGSFHLWNFDKNTDSWTPGITTGGHFDEVIDLCWEPSGEYLLSVSSDQTTRLHGQWKRGYCKKNTWHELARPQVHGYDMTCIAALSRYHFVSGAEEKVIRSFQATHNFVENFRKISAIKDDPEGDLILKSSAKGASVPSLGLSNKAVYDDNEQKVQEKHVNDIYPENYFVPLDLLEPPTEDNLMQNTLWPEVQKLYGHGYEIYCVATTSDGKVLASACKANNMEHASIILWNTSTWKQMQKLSSHQLTVTQLEFSPNNEHLLSVSRDRRWTVFSRTNDEQFENVATTNKQNGIHTRIIWCCCWTGDSNHFFTGSRDGKVVLWGKSKDDPSDSSLGPYSSVGVPVDIKESVTAVAVATTLLANESYLVAIGTEIGTIYLYECGFINLHNMWRNLIVMDKQQAHHLTVKRLKFLPTSNKYLASCGSDHVVKIHSIKVNDNVKQE